MTPPKRNQRLAIFAICAFFVISGTWLMLSALRANTQFFHTPSGLISEGFVPKSEIIRVGGLVVENSVSRGHDLDVAFTIKDFYNPEALPDQLEVQYSGVLPDLFAEGEGVVLIGKMIGEKLFKAQEILAKHDNNYMPKLPEAGT